MIDAKIFDAVDHKLALLSNLMAALDVLATEVGTISVQKRWDRVQRNGLIGVVESTIDRVKELAAEIDALRDEVIRMAAGNPQTLGICPRDE